MAVAMLLLGIAIVILAAKLGGEAATRLRQPAVVGELLVGVLLGGALLGGPLHLPALAAADAGHDAVVLEALATLGAVFLLFEVGLEIRLGELRKVGTSSAWVAFIGIAASFAVGYAASWALAARWAPWHAADEALPGSLLHVFVGAALTATSVGITARVLADLGRLATPEARIILGAAVLDDIGGLLILAIVAAMVDSGGAAVDPGALLATLGFALGFLVAAAAITVAFAARLFDRFADWAKVPTLALGAAVAFALLMAAGAAWAGLADIVGAFLAGLALAPSRRADKVARDLRPFASLLIGVFFVTLGMRVDVAEVARHAGPVLVVGALLSIVAIAAKLACGWGVVGRQADRLTVGVGMVPRGEVGLVFAGLGLANGLLANWQYATLIVVVLVTTLATPLWLARRRERFTPDLDGPAPSRDLAEVLDGGASASGPHL